MEPNFPNPRLFSLQKFFQLLLLFSPESSLSPFLLLTLTLPPVQFLKVLPAFSLLFLFTFSVVSSSSALLKSRHASASINHKTVTPPCLCMPNSILPYLPFIYIANKQKMEVPPHVFSFKIPCG